MPSNEPDHDHPGERIAKVLSRAGVASRRDAERMIEAGRVRVNGLTITSPALNVSPQDRISVDGNEIGPPEPVRIWLYHKPSGVVTTARDEEGRATIFDQMPDDLPYLMPVGRLDLTSEGLLLLTNDGGIKRRLELPSTAWLRRYRVRVNGEVDESALAALRAGVTVDGIAYQPMEVQFDRQQGANAWLTVGLREGRNREIRRVMEYLGLKVNRLIRISYGPFQLGELAPGAVEEVRSRMVRDQLGLSSTDTAPPQTAKADRPLLSAAQRRAGTAQVVRKPRPAGQRRRDASPEEAPKHARGPARGGPARDETRRPHDADAKPHRGKARDNAKGDRREDADRRGPRQGQAPYGDRPRKPRTDGPAGDGRKYASRGDGPRGARPDRNDDRPAYRGTRPGQRADGTPAPRGPRGDAPYKPRSGDAPQGDRRDAPKGARPPHKGPRRSDGPRGDRPQKTYAPRGDRSERGDDRPGYKGARPSHRTDGSSAPRGPRGDAPRGDRSRPAVPQGDRRDAPKGARPPHKGPPRKGPPRSGPARSGPSSRSGPPRKGPPRKGPRDK